MTTPDFRERQYVSRYALDVLGLAVNAAGVPTDVDSDQVMVVLVNEASNVPVFSRQADHVGTGLYEAQLTGEDSSVVGNFRVDWSYAIDGVPEVYTTYIQIGEVAPSYDRLAPVMKEVVDSVWIRFADLFDSPFGGPNLQTYFQSHFGRERIAQLLRIGAGRLNTMAQPYQTFTIDGPTPNFPMAQWGSLLETSTYIETLKHLIRSYVEQPSFVGGNVTRVDRRDYMDRWRSVLDDEESMFKSQLDVFKISMMGLGKPKVLVSGGVYGRFGPTRFAGSVAARPRYWTRFYTLLLFLTSSTLAICLQGASSESHHPQNSSPPGSGLTSISQEA